MNKFVILLLVTIALFVSVGLNSQNADQTQSASVNPLLTPTPLAEIERIKLDKNEALYACPYYHTPNSCGKDENGVTKKDNLLITVKPIVRNPKNIQIFYEYTVTGGRIVGQGREVLWNLDGIRPGVYTITASIRGERRVSAETKTESVTVKECDCFIPCIPCPTVAVDGGGTVKSGETVEFSARVSTGNQKDYSYDWTVSQGEIIEGQGTSKIKVKTSSETTGTLVATVKISSANLCQPCRPTASETATVVK